MKDDLWEGGHELEGSVSFLKGSGVISLFRRALSVMPEVRRRERRGFKQEGRVQSTVIPLASLPKMGANWRKETTLQAQYRIETIRL